MKEAINGAWLLGIVMVFMVVFIAYIAITINYSNAYQMRTRMITVVEEYQGLTTDTISYLENIRLSYSYTSKGVCNTSDEFRPAIGVIEGRADKVPSGRYHYCINREYRPGKEGSEDKYYYEVTVFFGFNLPVLGELFTFRVSGETNAIFYPSEYDLFEK